MFFRKKHPVEVPQPLPKPLVSLGYETINETGTNIIRSIWASPMRYDPEIRASLRDVIARVRNARDELDQLYG